MRTALDTLLADTNEEIGKSENTETKPVYSTEIPMNSRMWEQFLEELQLEILAESDAKKRGACIYIFSRLVDVLGADEDALIQLKARAKISPTMHRTLLLQELVKHWEYPNDTFFNALDSLEKVDNENGDLASSRRASIAIERLISGELPLNAREKLHRRGIPPETFNVRITLAIDAEISERTLDAFRQGNTQKEIEILRRLIGQDVNQGRTTMPISKILKY